MTKGFVTVATGQNKFYRLAVNLLKSYKLHSINPLPFAIIADRSNKYTDLFDKVIILSNPHFSYLDKIEMFNNPPFDYNIFIDADSLIFGDINSFFSHFPFNGVKSFGQIYPIESGIGWFKQENIGTYANKIHFCIGHHGGIVLFDKSLKTKEIYNTCLDITDHYNEFKFSEFINPADEPIIALSVAIHNCPPLIGLNGNYYANGYVFWPMALKIKANVKNGELDYLSHNKVWIKNNLILHFKTDNTHNPIYKTEVARINYHPFGVYFLQYIYKAIYYIKKVKWSISTSIYNYTISFLRKFSKDEN